MSSPASETSTYYGSWNTSQYSNTFVNGDAWAVVDRSSGKAVFTLRYNGMYNKGLVRKFDVTISRPDGVTAATASTSGCIMNATNKLNQQITFTAKTFTNSGISGTYSAFNPADFGTFSMTAKSFTEKDIPELYETSWCSIM